MARLDWDRLRRTRPLDGADVRVDPDGVHVWERPTDEAPAPIARRRLRYGVIVRKREPSPSASSAPSSEPPPTARTEVVWTSGRRRCPRCGARVSPRKMLRHARGCDTSREKSRP